MTKLLKVNREESGQRLDHYLVTQCPEFSRSYLQGMIEQGSIRVNGEPAKARSKIKSDDVVEILDIEPVELDIKPVDLQLDIVYEDSDLLVINKPQGLIVHPSASTKDQVTLVSGLLYHCQDRIDKDTSGLLVVAKNENAHHELSRQLKDKTMNRSYYALVSGVFKHDFAKVDAPIGRDSTDRQKMTVTHKNSKTAVTHLKTVEAFKHYTLLECSLETGRTHQIRVHLKYIGFPIVGDPKYAGKNEFGLTAQCLHAFRLELIHPTTHQRMTFTADLPHQFKAVLAEIRERDALE